MNLRVKTTYEVQGWGASTDIKTLYCHHYGSSDTVEFYDEDGSLSTMYFDLWSKNDKWSAMQKLWFPFKDEWGGELLDGVEHYYGEPWKENKQQ